MRLYMFLFAALSTVLVHAAVSPKASVREIAAQPLPLNQYRSPDTASSRFTALAGNPQPQSPQIRRSSQGPMPRLTVNDNFQAVLPELSLHRQTNADYSLLKTSQQNPVFTIDLRSGVTCWRLRTNVKLDTQKTVFLFFNQTNVIPGDVYSIQTLEQNSGELWESIPFRLRETRTGSATTGSIGGASQNVPIPDAGAVDHDLAKREAPNSSVSWPLFTARPGPPIHDSLGTFVGPCMFSIAYGLTVAVLCTMG